MEYQMYNGNYGYVAFVNGRWMQFANEEEAREFMMDLEDISTPIAS